MNSSELKSAICSRRSGCGFLYVEYLALSQFTLQSPTPPNHTYTIIPHGREELSCSRLKQNSQVDTRIIIEPAFAGLAPRGEPAHRAIRFRLSSRGTRGCRW